MAAAFTSLLELNGRLRSGAVKARGVVRETARELAGDAQPGGAVRAVLQDEAIRAARDVERELKRGRTRGVLQGAPFGVSELLQTAGRPAAWAPEEDPRQSGDAAAVERLRRARALPLAVLASPALGGFVSGPGAEEAACASVVARALLPFAVTLDFNGNVLRAALRHGCYALRPTFGTVSGYGAAPLTWTLGAVSVLARTAEDCGHVLAGMSGGDIRCQHSPGRTFRFAPEYARPQGELRILMPPGAPSAPPWIMSSGAKLLDAPVPSEPCLAVMEVLIASEAADAFQEELERSEDGRRYLEEARAAGAVDYLRAMRIRRSVQNWYSSAFTDADLAWLPCDADEIRRGWEESEPASGAVLWLAAALLAGAPVLACGAGAGNSRFPCCLTGRPGSENQLLRFAAAAAGGLA